MIRETKALESGPGIRGDRALTEEGTDLLGFTDMAEHMALALVDRASSDGIVVGLEGAWGSGKSSLLSLTLHALNQLPEAKRPSVVAFRPWLIGNRDALLTSLFDDLSRAVDAMRTAEGDATGTTLTFVKDAGDRLRTYGQRLGSLAPLASLASLASVPGAAIAEKVLKGLGEAAKGDSKDPPLSALKKSLDDMLGRLPRRIVVTIDDVDRLDPNEISEILRLVRSVADFTNVVYVLCYDPDIVAQAVKSAMNIPDGKAFLEKIVQVSIRVPAPEPFALRRMFSNGLREIVGAVTEEDEARLTTIIDQEGGRRLRTPRAVVRTLDALRFNWPALSGRVNLPDLVWLHLIKIANVALFEWIEGYVASMAAASSGRSMVSKESRTEAFAVLEKVLLLENSNFDEARWRLYEFLPGISISGLHDQKGATAIFIGFRDGQRFAAIKGKRLASPDHHRLYFALAMPSGAPVESDFLALWEAADIGPDEVIGLLTSWVGDNASGAGSKIALMLDRLQSVSGALFTEQRSSSLIIAFSNVLDTIGMRADPFEFGDTTWSQAENLLPILRKSIPDQGRGIVMKAFRKGRALSWLVRIFRNELFSHGRCGDASKPEETWILDEGELDEVVNVMHRRFEAMSTKAILTSPNPLSLLFSWVQSGGANEVRRRISASIRTDNGLLHTLAHLATGVRSSDTGDELIITRQGLEHFADYDAVRARVVSLAEKGGKLSDQAKVIRTQFERARDF